MSEPRKYAVVTSGGRNHVAWLWTWTPECRAESREPTWWLLCGRRDLNHAFIETDEPADCRRCWKAMEWEQLRIRGALVEANTLRSSYAKQVVALARNLDALDQMFTPDFETQMEDAS